MRWGGGGYGRRGGGLSGPCGQQSAASEVRTPAPPPRICRYPSQSVETHHVYNQCRSFRIIRDTMELPDSSRHTGYVTRLSEIILVKSSDESSEILNTWYRCWYMMCPVKQDLLVSRMTRVYLTLTSIKQQQPQHDHVIFHGPVFQVADI